MLKLCIRVRYSENQSQYLKKLGISTSSNWDKNDAINAGIKQSIKKQLLYHQNNKCVYCGLALGGTSRPEIEHIAPKGRHPEFEYTKTNLAMACSYCNGSSKKGQKDTIETKNSCYEKCKFYIVHPYYDNANDFFKYEGAVIRIQDSLNADEQKKAEYTMEMFEWDDPFQVQEREKQIIYELAKAKKMTFDDIVTAIGTYK